MGFYANRVAPRIINKACGAKSLRGLRARVCEGLAGEVIEIGFGSGLNVAYYPSTITRVTAVEPSDVAWKLATKRLAATPISVERAGLDGQALPFDDDTFDAGLTTWTMCTIPDVKAALLEMRRVLKTGASLHFLEHGLAPDAKVQRWQRRMDPIEKRLAAGCTFSRPILKLLTDAGFSISDVEVFYEKGAPKFASAFSLGVAHAA
jgi:ubiquinone/menaquinone biosynthesis C-methylase UbiE